MPNPRVPLQRTQAKLLMALQAMRSTIAGRARKCRGANKAPWRVPHC